MIGLKKIKVAAVEKNGRADSMLGQKSGPALAGPAASATTALLPHLQGRAGIMTFLFSLPCYRPHSQGTNWWSKLCSSPCFLQ